MDNNENGNMPNVTLFDKLKKSLETSKEVFKLSSQHDEATTSSMIEISTAKIRFKKTDRKSVV